MMCKFIFYTFWVCVIGFALTSCYDDKGNYDYTELAEIRIDTAGLAAPIFAEGTILRFDKMECAPNIYYDGKLVNEDDNAPLDYTWTIYSTIGLGGSDDDKKIDTLAKTRILDAEISRVPGQYIVQLTVTDRKSGWQQYLKLNRTVEGKIPASGWMVLYEPSDKPGMSDVGLVYNEWVKKNWLSDDITYWNLYSSSNGTPVEGKPLKINYTITSLPTSLIVIATEKVMCAVHEETFQRELTINDFFYEPPTSGALTAYVQACWMPTSPSFGETVLYDNKIYVGGNGTRPMGVPSLGEYGELAPWLCLFHPVTGLNTVVYDNTNGRFLGVTGVKVMPFAAQAPSPTGFDVNNVGAKFIKGDWGTGNMEYFIMKKDNSYFFARANFMAPASPAMGTIWKDITASPDIAEINTFAMPYTGNYAFYGAKNKVYRLFYTMNDVAEELWEIPVDENQNGGEMITCIELQKFGLAAWMNMGLMPNVNEVLHVATWNESTKKGKLYQFKIDAIDGSIKSEPKVYSVPGKVKSMGWKFTMMER